jgi:HAD superfamily hydrolase (TIGR01509 family)
VGRGDPLVVRQALPDAPLTRGVIFDCDGTLVDSEPLSGEAWRRIMAPHGYEITAADIEACVGGTYARTHAYFSNRAPLPDPETVWSALSKELFALIDAQLEPFDDAITAVAELRAKGVKIAVASSSVRERLDRTLARAGLEFEITIAGDEIEHGKPAPDMFLEAARRMGLPPARCAVVEDSGPGVAAGVAAGMPTLGVCRVPGTEASLQQADRIVHTVTADAILALL